MTAPKNDDMTDPTDAAVPAANGAPGNAPSVALVPRAAFDRLQLLPNPLASADTIEDGHDGVHRNRDIQKRPPLIPANNDWDAVQCFLADKAQTGSPHTLRAYEKECLRLLLFCRFVAHKPLSSLDRNDAYAYAAFLRAPPPAFVQPRLSGDAHVPVTLWLPNGQFNPHWRPFRSAKLSDASQRTALAAVKSLTTYLVNADYLVASPFQLGRLTGRDPRAVRRPTDRVLRVHAKRAIDAVIDALPSRTERQRLQALRTRYIVDLFYYLGLRASEAIGGTMGDFFVERERWWLRTLGKGQKERTVPVPAPLLRTVIDYRRGLDLPSDYPLPDDTTPLVLSVNGTQGIGYSQLLKLLKALFQQAADRLEASEGAVPNPETVADIAALRRATPHWFRHTYATDLFDAAVDPRIVKENLGHASMDTTLIYSHTEDRARHEQTQRLAPHPKDSAGDEPSPG